MCEAVRARPLLAWWRASLSALGSGRRKFTPELYPGSPRPCCKKRKMSGLLTYPTRKGLEGKLRHRIVIVPREEESLPPALLSIWPRADGWIPSGPGDGGLTGQGLALLLHPDSEPGAVAQAGPKLSILPGKPSTLPS